MNTARGILSLDSTADVRMRFLPDHMFGLYRTDMAGICLVGMLAEAGAAVNRMARLPCRAGGGVLELLSYIIFLPSKALGEIIVPEALPASYASLVLSGVRRKYARVRDERGDVEVETALS